MNDNANCLQLARIITFVASKRLRSIKVYDIVIDTRQRLNLKYCSNCQISFTPYNSMFVRIVLKYHWGTLPNVNRKSIPQQTIYIWNKHNKLLENLCLSNISKVIYAFGWEEMNIFHGMEIWNAHSYKFIKFSGCAVH